MLKLGLKGLTCLVAWQQCLEVINMAEETTPSTEVQPAAKDPVFLLMVSGQIESAEVEELL